MNLRSLIFLLLLTLGGCAHVSLQDRWRHADELAAQAGWQKLSIRTDTFDLTAFIPTFIEQRDLLTVYIEGDGLAWLSRSRPSSDPTPRNPVGLRLAMHHPQGAAAYLARPCQYVNESSPRNCKQTYWTNGRFSEAVIAASDQAIDELKRRFSARKLVLVGYSGGGAVAALVAARRNDVAELVTVAGNLDHQAWTRMHRVQPLDASLNPVDAWQSLAAIPQRHFVGGADSVVTASVTESFASFFPASRRPKIIEIPEFSHDCCWVEGWEEIWGRGRD
ncbi:MAG: alpha/beta hydrolase [Gallionella sp.]|nr:alpha/beta hydrolase [Gallionella sp.]